MKLNKKILLIAAACSAMALTACGGSGTSSAVTSSAATSSAATSTAKSSTADTNTYAIKLWVSETKGVSDQFKSQVEAFAAANSVTITPTIETVSEANSATQMLTDVDAGADLYCFAQDQFARLVQGGALAKLGVKAAETVTAENDAGSVAAVTSGDSLYAYPMTSDNGYFMSIIWLFPFVCIVLQSFRCESTQPVGYIIPQKWGFDNYVNLFTTTNFPKWLLNTFIISIVTALLQTVIVLCMMFVGPGWLNKAGRWEQPYSLLRKSYCDGLDYYAKLKKEGKLIDMTMSEYAAYYRKEHPSYLEPEVALWKDVLYGSNKQYFWYYDPFMSFISFLASRLPDGRSLCWLID